MEIVKTAVSNHKRIKKQNGKREIESLKFRIDNNNLLNYSKHMKCIGQNIKNREKLSKSKHEFQFKEKKMKSIFKPCALQRPKQHNNTEKQNDTLIYKHIYQEGYMIRREDERR